MKILTAKIQPLNDLENPIIPKQKLFWKSSLAAALLWGSGNFALSLIKNKDFAVSCLVWTGFVITSLIFQLCQFAIAKKNKVQISLFGKFFEQLYHRQKLCHTILRSINYFLVIWLTILIAEICETSHVNFGLIICVFSSSIVFQVIIFRLKFQEKLSKLKIAGILIIITGVIFITLSSQGNQTYEDFSENFKSSGDKKIIILAIGIALIIAALNCIRVVQAKYIDQYLDYPPIQFSLDGALICGGFQAIISIYYVIEGHPNYSGFNYLICFIAGALLQGQSLLSLHAAVKGLAAPCSAIVNTHSIVSTILIALFTGIIPSIYQIIGFVITLLGVLSAILG
ncbi:UNKNOWN [Stylonychia lemnae]|uniref:EamA domain-containing protein n=1 Tax=Stylonychia lemnae TaxID=5949 RepID=A0A078AMP3_STYLE|nr:UNKNOWN [Stylonychia lemnae]|eukprot:CDW83665.1 UNKNOWN [Stylonychia lemnae]